MMTSNQEKQIDINRENIKDLEKKVDKQEDKVFDAIENLGKSIGNKFDTIQNDINTLSKDVLTSRENQYREFRDFCSIKRKELLDDTTNCNVEYKKNTSYLILKAVGAICLAVLSIVGVGYNYGESKVSKEIFIK